MAQSEHRDVRTPVTVLTGFLGSGKTTLLNRALRDPALSRTAVVINEFGEIGLDHALAAASDDSIIVLENGCLCCTVFGDLVGTLNRLYHERESKRTAPFDWVTIETSGLADPAPVLQAFLSEPTLAGLYRIAAVVATVDAINAEHTLSQHEESVRQAALADVIVITKLDLAPPEHAATLEQDLRARLRRLNPSAKILIAGTEEAAPAGLLRRDAPEPTAEQANAWLNAAAYAHSDHDHDHAHPHTHAHATQVESFCFTKDEPVAREALDLLLTTLEKNLGPNLLRVKGLVNVEGAPGPAVIQGAQHLLHNLTWLDAWPDDDRRTRIVFITQNFDAAEVESMVATLERVAARTAAARLRAKKG